MLAKIKEIIQSSDYPIKSESGLKNYAGHIHRLCRFTESTPETVFIQDDALTKIENFIDSKKSASTKNQVVCAIKKLADIQKNKNFIKFGEIQVKKTILLRKSDVEKVRIKKKKTLNWINYNVLRKRYELALDVVKFYDDLKLDFKLSDIVEDYHANLEFAVLVGLYISDIKINPPRRAEAWYNCKVVKKMPKTKTSLHNFIVTNKKGLPVKIVLYKYKTFERYGRKEYLLNPDLSFLLKKWIEYNSEIESDYLFGKQDGEHVSNTQFSNKIKTIIRKCCIKKINFSTNMLRNVAITELYKNIDITKIPVYASMCGHSFTTALDHYINSNKLPKNTIITEEECKEKL